jgi:MYXO-CTERM domain-containing protein
LEDPLLTLGLPDLWLDFHVFMDDRWVRVLSLHMDVDLPIGIDFNPDNQIIPIIGDLSEGLENLTLANGDLFVDDLDLVVTILPALLSTFAGGATAGLIEPITLPDILGYRLDMQEGSVGGIEENSVLAIFARFGVAEEGEELRASVDTAVELIDVDIPDRDTLLAAGVDAWKLSSITVDIDAWDSRIDDVPMEYSFRIDQSNWSPFSPVSSGVIRHPQLFLQGHHRLEVRARRVDDYHSLDPTPGHVDLIMDSVAPRLALHRDDERVEVDVFDWVSDAEQIRLEYRMDGGGWILLMDPEFTIDDAEQIEVRATDEAGNESIAELRIEAQGLIGRLPPAPEGAEAGCGCTLGQSTSSTGGWLIFGLIGLLGLGRRRLRVAALMGIGLLGLLGCEDRAPGTEGDAPDSGPVVPMPDAMVEPPCVPPTDISEGCGDASECPPGFELTLGTVNPQTCMAECPCAELPGLDPGPIGRYSDLVIVDGVAWVSAYAEAYGDLVVGRHDGENGFAWQWVDGRPAEGEIVAGPSGPRGGVADPGPDVGQYTSMAAGSNGSLHVAYYDVDERALRYARGAVVDGRRQWRTMTIAREGDAGRWPSLTVGADGMPGIAYRVASLDGISQLHYVAANTDEPTSPDDWNEPLVVHARDLGDLEPETGSYPEGTGLFTSSVRDGEGMPVLAWYDRSGGQLWWSRMAEAGFTQPELLAGWGHPDIDRDGDMGANVDLQLDADGQAHLCYQDGMTDSLRYLSPALERDEWVDDGVWIDAGGRPYATHVVGDDCNVRIDEAGNPLIVYQDSTYHALILRRRNIDGADDRMWSGRDVLRGDLVAYRGSFGFFASAEVSGGRLWVTHYLYNNQVDPPRAELELIQIDL